VCFRPTAARRSCGARHRRRRGFRASKRVTGSGGFRVEAPSRESTRRGTWVERRRGVRRGTQEPNVSPPSGAASRRSRAARRRSRKACRYRGGQAVEGCVVGSYHWHDSVRTCRRRAVPHRGHRPWRAVDFPPGLPRGRRGFRAARAVGAGISRCGSWCPRRSSTRSRAGGATRASSCATGGRGAPLGGSPSAVVDVADGTRREQDTRSERADSPRHTVLRIYGACEHAVLGHVFLRPRRLEGSVRASRSEEAGREKYRRRPDGRSASLVIRKRRNAQVAESRRVVREPKKR